MIKILLAEDQVLFRRALGALLSSIPDMEVVAEAHNGDEVMPRALETTPDVALIDIEMPERDGISIAGDLHRALPHCRVLILTVFGRPGYLRRAIDAGVAGFLLKESTPEDLVTAIRRVAAGESAFDPELALSTLKQEVSPLTRREREVLALSWAGASAEEIAERLHLTSATVRNYLSIVIQKLHARNRIDAARIAEEKGWL